MQSDGILARGHTWSCVQIPGMEIGRTNEDVLEGAQYTNFRQEVAGIDASIAYHIMMNTCMISP